MTSGNDSDPSDFILEERSVDEDDPSELILEQRSDHQENIDDMIEDDLQRESSQIKVTNSENEAYEVGKYPLEGVKRNFF
jgi:hypothetical protein